MLDGVAARDTIPQPEPSAWSARTGSESCPTRKVADPVRSADRIGILSYKTNERRGFAMQTRVQVRHLPHWNLPGATYFVTGCLEGSVPAQGLLDLEQYRAKLQQQPCPEGIALPEWDLRRWKRHFARRDE